MSLKVARVDKYPPSVSIAACKSNLRANETSQFMRTAEHQNLIAAVFRLVPAFLGGRPRAATGALTSDPQ